MERTKHNRGSSVWSFGAKGLLLLVVLLFGLMLAGCQKREKPLENGESEYQIYYMNQAVTLPHKDNRHRSTHRRINGESASCAGRSGGPGSLI